MFNLYYSNSNQIYISAKLSKSMEMNPLMEKQPSPFKGFWIRALAFMIDSIILGVAIWACAIVFGIFVGSLFGEDAGFGVGFLVFILASFATILYKPLMEASEYQGTFGKHFLGMKVIDKNGRRITTGKSFIRTMVFMFQVYIPIINWVSWLALIMIVFTEENQGLHDVTAETYVVSKYWQGPVPLQDNFGA
mgnify:FL=1